MLRKQGRRIVNRLKREVAKRRNLAVRRSPNLKYVILTMTRGAENRIEEWVRYHAGIGITDFHIVLDNPIDDTESVLKRTCAELNVGLIVEVKEASGDYHDGLSLEERRQKRKDWREKQTELNKSKGYPKVYNFSPQARRQFIYFSEILTDYDERSKNGEHGWVAVIDDDEFISPIKWPDIPSMTGAFPEAVRLRLHNFDFDTSDHDPAKPFLEQHFYRWSRAGIEAHGNGWEKRFKTLVWWGHLSPFMSVHIVSKGKAQIIDHEDARLHHFRIPNHGMIDYDVRDESTLEKWIVSHTPKD